MCACATFVPVCQRDEAIAPYPGARGAVCVAIPSDARRADRPTLRHDAALQP
jgi:hypothetical protein